LGRCACDRKVESENPVPHRAGGEPRPLRTNLRESLRRTQAGVPALLGLIRIGSNVGLAVRLTLDRR
jgi:hypothetical protein